MHRKGHVGMALLAFAPVAYVLVSDGKLALAVLCWLGIQTVEPLPDFDFALSFLNHRGVSHSLFAVVLVGGVLGAIGWFVGGNLFDLLLTALLAGGDLFGWILGRLPDIMANMINLLLPNISLEAVVNRAHQIAGESVTRRTFAAYGLFVGAYGVFVHLLGDVITDMGIAPFLPLSRWRLSLSPLHADNPVANSSLFFLGVLAIAVVLAATVPGMVLGASAPATLSPVGVASGQDAGPLVAPNGSAEINETRSTRQRIVLESVTLPRNGFIVAQTGTGNVSVNQSSSKTKVVGHTQYVRHGTFRGVVLSLDKPIRGSATVSVSLWNDTNSNQTLDVGGGKADAPYQKNGTPIHDSIRFGANQSQSQSQNRSQNQNTSNAAASVTVSNQTTNGSTVTVKRVTLPSSGFVVLDSTGPSEEGPLEESTIAVSQRLSAGTHRNVTLRVNNSPPGGLVNRTTLNNTGTYEAILYRDSNNNSRFEFITSGRNTDRPFIVRSGSTARLASDAARITVPGSRTPTPTASIRFQNQTTNGSTVTIQSVTLPNGGFVVVRNERYLNEGDPLQTVVGVSQYLSPGTHRTVTVPVRNGSVQHSQTVVAMPARDTNDNQRYDYIRSDGFLDVAYTGNNQIITDQAAVTVRGSATSTPPSMATDEPLSPTTTQPSSNGSETRNAGGDGVGSWIGSHPLGVGLVVIVVLVVLPTIIRRF